MRPHPHRASWFRVHRRREETEPSSSGITAPDSRSGDPRVPEGSPRVAPGEGNEAVLSALGQVGDGHGPRLADGHVQRGCGHLLLFAVGREGGQLR